MRLICALRWISTCLPVVVVEHPAELFEENAKAIGESVCL